MMSVCNATLEAAMLHLNLQPSRCELLAGFDIDVLPHGLCVSLPIVMNFCFIIYGRSLPS
jgi:hypothetical protein